MPTGTPGVPSARQVTLLAVVGLCLVAAGCSGLAIGGEATESPTTDPHSPTAAPGGDDGHSHGGDNHSHGDDGHSHGNDTHTDADGADDGNTSADGSGDDQTPADDAATGKLTVVVNGTELDLQSLGDSSAAFRVAADDEHTWVATGDPPTLADGLAAFGVDAAADALTYDGTTYREGADGTTLSYRVNGEPVDPTEHDLSDGDEVWVTVETPTMNVSTPGTYIRADQQHIHGDMTVTIDGTTLDFSQERYQSSHRHFHYEGGDADEWHAHSWSITLSYALSTFPDVEATSDAVTYNGTTYDASDEDTTIVYEVNGEPVDPDGYYLKDGDDVTVSVEVTG